MQKKTKYIIRNSGLLLCLVLSGLYGMMQAQTVADGEELYKKGKYAEAKQVFESVIQKDDKNAEAYCDLGQVYLTHTFVGYDIEKAVENTEKAVEIAPGNAHIQYMYGAALGIKVQNAGVLKQAFLAPKVKQAFVRSVELDPQFIPARVALAQYYMMAPGIMGGSEDEAWKQVDEIIKQDELQGRMVKAGFLSRNKKNEEAEKEFQILVAAYPKEWKVYHRYGYFCFRLERYDDAMKQFQKYIALRPDTADSYQSYAEALLKKGDVDQAMKYLDQSLKLDQQYVPAIISLGEAYQLKGMKKEAKEHYEQALTLSQNEYYKKQAEKKLKEVE